MMKKTFDPIFVLGDVGTQATNNKLKPKTGKREEGLQKCGKDEVEDNSGVEHESDTGVI